MGLRALVARDSYSRSGPISERVGDAFRERATYETTHQIRRFLVPGAQAMAEALRQNSRPLDSAA
jgi:hypothetical protein